MSMDLQKANEHLREFYSVIGKKAEASAGKQLKVGVDLGTANICIAVLDGDNRPVTGELYPASVVRDGLVVDYIGAVEIVKTLKGRIESRLGTKLEFANAAVPPGTVGKNAMAVVNVVQSADMQIGYVVDEPTAAANVLDIENGAVVDVGGGTTGISIIRDRQVIASHDQATGGGHMTLVLAGNRGISISEAEKIKLDKNNHRDIFLVIRPVIEKMASIVNGFIRDYDVDTIYVVGGASSFDGFDEVFEKECRKRVIKPDHGLLVTPLGIAMLDSEEK